VDLLAVFGGSHLALGAGRENVFVSVVDMHLLGVVVWRELLLIHQRVLKKEEGSCLFLVSRKTRAPEFPRERLTQ
jgi:hypothetical protein